MDIDILRTSIEIAKEENILDYPFVRGVYNNLELNNKKPQESDNSQGSFKNTILSTSYKNIIPQKSDFYTIGPPHLNYLR